MIKITCSKELYTYNAYHLASAFFSEETAKVYTDVSQEAAVIFDINGSAALPGRELARPDKDTEKKTDTYRGNRRIIIDNAKTKDEIDKKIYHALSEFTGKTLPWGLLTGVRPTKPAMSKLKGGMGRDEFISWYGKEKLVSEEKAALAWDIAKREMDVLNKIFYQDKKLFPGAEDRLLSYEGEKDREKPSCKGEENGNPAEENSIGKEALKAAALRKDGADNYCPAADSWLDTASIYIGIPFCPSICSYCSFSLGTISRFADKMDDYINALCAEIEGVSGLCKGKRIMCIYIGGGTPTSLTTPQLERLIRCINKNFKVNELKEFCVEAGRPDTVTKEKLSLLKEFGVGRISINPQTMQQKTLDKVGRAHSAGQVYEAFSAARQLGFDNINMDLIAGLPEETAADMADTVRKVLALSPESLTVHALSIKRRAAMESQSASAEAVSEMISLAYETACAAGMSPYYLYRQKNIAGNFENMGYARPGKEGLYNILTMEEVQTIFGLGAGAETKVILKNPVPNPNRKGKPARILRCGNIKDINGYINNAEEMMQRKEMLLKQGSL